MPTNDVLPASRPPPVFVDDTGRRHRLVRLAGYALALLTVAYLALMGLSMVSSPDVAPLAIPGLGRLFPGPAAPSIVVAGHSRRPGDVVGRQAARRSARPAGTTPASTSPAGSAVSVPVPTLTPTPGLSASSTPPTSAVTAPVTSPSATSTPPAPTATVSTRPPAPTTTPTVTRGTGSPTARPTAHPTPHSRAQPAGGSPSPTAT